MKNRSSVIIGGLLLALFVVLVFFFQVRRNEVAFLTTFGAASTKPFPPGLHFKWPWPIQRVHKFDARVQNFESKFEETLTKDGKPILVSIFFGWCITDPQRFGSSFGNSTNAAIVNLEGLVGSVKSATVGKHPFADFINTDEKELKFVEIEQEMLKTIKEQAQVKYGIEVRFVGIKRLGLPEQITSKVFERMKAERQQYVDKSLAEGESQAITIRAEATRTRDEMIADAEAVATRTRGAADARATEAYSEMEKNPGLAVFLQKLSSMEAILKDKATLILDSRTAPFDLLRGTNNLPARKP